MTLAIGWLHDGGDTVETWLHQAGDWQFLRREGLRDGDLERFRAEALGGLSGKAHSAQDRRQIQELERLNAKQAKRLREAEVLLELQKKVQELWGAKDDDTSKN